MGREKRMADDDRLRSLAEERQRERAGSRLHAALMLALVQSGGEGEGAWLIGRPPRPVSPGAIFRGWEQNRDRSSELRHSWDNQPASCWEKAANSWVSRTPLFRLSVATQRSDGTSIRRTTLDAMARERNSG